MIIIILFIVEGKEGFECLIRVKIVCVMWLRKVKFLKIMFYGENVYKMRLGEKVVYKIVYWLWLWIL